MGAPQLCAKGEHVRRTGRPPDETLLSLSNALQNCVGTQRRKDRSMKKRLLIVMTALFLLALLTIGGGFVSHPLAHAASACMSAPSDANCDNVPPDSSGCGADGTTLVVVAVGTGTVAVRYSPTCKSAWAHTTNGVSVSLQATVTRSPGSPSYTSSAQGTGVKSNMVYIGGHQQVEACGYVGNVSGVGGTSACTGWTTY